MSDLERRRSYTPRRAREQRAYRLLLTGGTAGAIGVVGIVLAIAGVTTTGWPIIALLVAAACFVAFRATVAR